MHRPVRVLPVVCLLGLALGLSACASDTVDLAAADAWLASVAAKPAGADVGIGAASGRTMPFENSGDRSAGVILTLAEPAPASAVEVRCFGGHTATVSVEASTTSGSRGVETSIDCDEKPHSLELVDATRTTAVRIAVRAEPETRYYADVR
ncbi:hypothetical protein A9Z40_15290 [Microbacterium arborescens]|uniref:Uncharacterized protein n=2 Tax=Microbacterium TaxID=33882 RepID=A0ABU1HZU7_9MICO|nr:MULTISPECIES: hypothetical protein [Microbacterium]MDR6167171.1 hypothetical protein [Microbacterium paludicola]OAZ42869.1 hypothetical protein A9Z40_15290 [Microbacterium arborescens]QCR41106.1 hypothetical protein C1N74_12290 [Microbacterium sp. SGAir0570]